MIKINNNLIRKKIKNILLIFRAEEMHKLLLLIPRKIMKDYHFLYLAIKKIVICKKQSRKYLIK